MNKLWIVALVATGVLGSCFGGLVAADASPRSMAHVVEPMSPITAFRLDVYDYAGKGRLKCDGTDVITLSSLRIEPRVTYAAAPSEHWTTELRLSRVENGRGSFVDGIVWRHQNVPPHPETQPEWMGASWQYWFQGDTGNYTLTARIVTDMTHREFYITCRFARINP